MKEKNKRSTKYLITSVLCAGLSLFSGCKQRQLPVDEATKNQILLKGVGAEVQDLDPHTVYGAPEQAVLLSLFEGLVTPNPITLEPEPGVAESWKISEDGKTYHFKIRDNAKWSNGDPVTAHDFVYSIKRLLSPKLGAPYAQSIYFIEGAEAFNKGETQDFETVGVKAINDNDLEIKLNESTPYFLAFLVNQTWYPVHANTIAKFGEMDQRGTPWTRAGNIVSNGPFKLKNWEVSEVIEVERNPYYWNKDIVKLNGIKFYPIDNTNTEERAFRSGQLHITETVPVTKIKSYIESQAPELRIRPYFSTYSYIFNTSRPPFNDNRVRRALGLSLSRDDIINKVTNKGEYPAYTFVPPGIKGYESENSTRENINEARKLLAEAGYPGGAGFPTVVLMYNTNENHKAIAEAIQHMWSKNLGINIELQNMEWKVYLSMRSGDEFDIYRFGWVGDYPDPNSFLELFKSKSMSNLAKWGNKRYDELLEEASKTQDSEKRFKLLGEAEGILMRELPVLPIYYYNLASLVHPSVQGYSDNVMDMHPYQYVYLKEPLKQQ